MLSIRLPGAWPRVLSVPNISSRLLRVLRTDSAALATTSLPALSGGIKVVSRTTARTKLASGDEPPDRVRASWMFFSRSLARTRRTSASSASHSLT